MVKAVSVEEMAAESHAYRHTGGVSDNNRHRGFVPAFLDTATGIIHLSRNPDGTPAVCHCMDGLPDELVCTRNTAGHAETIKETVIAGFERDGCFFTREQAACVVDRN
ncbi:MAG TPA: hypothetical protein VKA32_01325 [Gammaproteobacteria bacterium]|nr:hypothetical protein [Gammaproteobacteria bacterium]